MVLFLLLCFLLPACSYMLYRVSVSGRVDFEDDVLFAVFLGAIGYVGGIIYWFALCG